MPITHTEAHKLIQYGLDQALGPEKQKSLSVHLDACEGCRRYTIEMHNLENQLRHVRDKQWSHTPLPLSIDPIKTQINLPKRPLNLFPLRTVLVSIVLVGFSFFIWQLASTMYQPSGQTSSTILPIPTPSIDLSTPSLASTTCEWTLYTVKTQDTLDSIAFQYSVSKQDIMNLNSMDSELVSESMEIKIPQCNATPTTTAHLPTTTLTPNLELIIDTPG